MTGRRKTASSAAYKRVRTADGEVTFRKDTPLGRIIYGLKQAMRRFFRFLFSKTMLAIMGSLVFTFMIFAIIGLIYYATMLPDIQGLAAAKEQPGIEFTAEDGTLLARYGEISGEYIPYDRLPRHLINAVVATEDRRFFSHFGVDPMGILRAMVVNVKEGGLVQGGSTITQQLAKNIFLTNERTFSRKIQELMMSFWLEQTFSKQEILAIYLNRVYLGGGSYGVDSAARFYFDKSVEELDLVESAMIAGLLKAPSRYNPTANTELAVGRTQQVILNMQEAGKITETEATQAIASLKNGEKEFKQYAFGNQRYFTDWIAEQIPDYAEGITEDIIVETTIDANWQKAAEQAITEVMTDDVRAKNKVEEAALLAMRPNGAIVSMVGGIDYNKSQYNRAIQAKRQPGSAFKLFVYLAAMENGYTPDMLFMDAPITVGKWRPQNYNNEYRGQITLRQALADSSNAIAVKLSQMVGINQVRNTAKRLGIKTKIPEMPSIALGAVEVTLKDMVTAFAHLANNGRAVKPYGIVRIRRKQDGKVLYARTDRDDFSDIIVVNPNNVAKMNAMLSSVVQSGTGTAAAIGRPAAGKTGTTSDYKDAWFIGYTPSIVAGVWVGNDKATVMNKVTGGNLPARIWKSYMMSASADLPVQELPVYYSQSSPTSYLPWHQPEHNPATPMQGQPVQPVQPQPVQPQGGDYQLNNSFWDKLFDEQDVQYEYPSGR